MPQWWSQSEVKDYTSSLRGFEQRIRAKKLYVKIRSPFLDIYTRPGYIYFINIPYRGIL